MVLTLYSQFFNLHSLPCLWHVIYSLGLPTFTDIPFSYPRRYNNNNRDTGYHSSKARGILLGMWNHNTTGLEEEGTKAPHYINMYISTQGGSQCAKRVEGTTEGGDSVLGWDPATPKVVREGEGGREGWRREGVRERVRE